MIKEDIKNFTLAELEKKFIEMDEPSYRARQAYFWLYKKGVASFHMMKNLPKGIVEKLDQKYYINSLELYQRLKSRDRTEKFVFKLHDANYIETVLIETRKRKTICLSTQVGCRFGCSFCASGKIHFKRNLLSSEITGQILFVQHNLGHKITHSPRLRHGSGSIGDKSSDSNRFQSISGGIGELTNFVFMGIGEPLDNYENVAKAIKIMNEEKGMNIGARRITISTCGMPEGIEKLGELGLQVNLAISLHAAGNDLRNTLVPINKKYPLEKLITSCKKYMQKTNRIITIEYIVIKNINDSKADAIGLGKIAKELKAKVNLMRYNEILDVDFKSPNIIEMASFVRKVEASGVNVTLRRSKGSDIQAGCGQLAGQLAR